MSSTTCRVLHKEVLLKLFSSPSRGPCGGVRPSIVNYGRRRRLTLRATHRDVILLGGRGGFLPLGQGGVESVTMMNVDTTRYRFKSCDNGPGGAPISMLSNVGGCTRGTGVGMMRTP